MTKKCRKDEGTYVGWFDEENQKVVTVDGKELPMRNDLVNTKISRFDWGYRGPAPRLLALSILCDALRDDRIALLWYKDFAIDVIQALDGEKPWGQTKQSVVNWLVLKLKDELNGKQKAFGWAQN